MSNHKNIHTKLKKSNPDTVAYMEELIAINTKLHKQNIKFQAQSISDKNRISELEKQLQEANERAGIQIVMKTVDTSKQS